MDQRQRDSYTVSLYNALCLACELDALKWKIRTGWKIWMIKKRRESIAEHCFSALILAELLHPLHPDHDKIDINKVREMLIWHEIGEKIIGDIPEIAKNHGDKAEAEHEAWKELLKKLSKEQRDHIYDLLIEFDAHETPESKFAYYIDKFDANKMIKHYSDAGRVPKLKWIMFWRKIVRKNETIQRLVREGAKTPVEIWLSDDYAHYRNDEFFMDAHKLLQIMDASVND